MKTLAALVPLMLAFTIGLLLRHPPQALPETHVMSPWERCSNTLVAEHWSAGDLCDTLPPSTDVTQAQWNRYNKINKWREVSPNCWDTSATTGQRYTICFDGTIRRH